MADVTKRMLDLLSALQSGRGYAGPELAALLGVSTRTLRRDVDRLRDYGYPVHTRPGPAGGYRLIAGGSMPPLLLDDDEAVAAQVALTVVAAMQDSAPGSISDSTARAQAKLDQVLPERLRPHAAALRDALDIAWPATPAVDAGVLGVLGDAISRRRIVRFRYRRGSAAAAGERRVEPYRQLHRHLRWYLLAWDLDREDWRTFRLDRLSDIEMSTFGFTARPLPAESADAHLTATLRRDRTRVVLEVHGSADTVRDALPWEDLELEQADEGRTRVVLHVAGWPWLVHTLAVLPPAVVVEPAAFAAGIRSFAERMLSTR